VCLDKIVSNHMQDTCISLISVCSCVSSAVIVVVSVLCLVAPACHFSFLCCCRAFLPLSWYIGIHVNKFCWSGRSRY
jgi:hypothetical protein